MSNLFEKIYNEYLMVLKDLEIGYGFEHCDLSEIWKLIHTCYFIKFGEPTEDEMILLADYYSDVESFIEDIDIE